MQLGKYQLIHKLATGGMAEVFLAKAAGPMGFEKLLVLKRILPHLATEPTFVDMFLSEARLAAQLNHPNIVQIFDFGEAEGTYFLAMEYIDGANLREIIRRATSVGLALPIPFCARVVAAACEGLAFAHDCKDQATQLPMNLIHRDISPDNILLSRQGAVKVVDFGIAKAGGASPHTQTGILKGKLSYMAPEQLRNEPLDRRADVYALGVVLYELLTGVKPFVATSEAGMVQAILFELQVPVAQRRPDVPEVLQRILARALSRERDQRYPDCASFQADLEDFLLSTGKPMGASQMALFVSMMMAGSEGSLGTGPRTASIQSHPRFTTSVPKLETLPSVRPLAEPLLIGEPPPLAGHELKGERTSVERPSRLLLQHSPSAPQAPVSPGPPLPQPSPLMTQQPSARGAVWAPLVAVLLVLAGAGFLSQLPPNFSTVESSDAGTVPAHDAGPQAPNAGVASPAAENPGHSDGGQIGPGSHARDAGLEEPTDGGTVGNPLPHRRRPGSLDLLIVPEALLWVDGWQYGMQRKKVVPLEPGKHRLRVINKQLGKDLVREFTITAGQTTQVDIHLLEE
jgi:serine/threonine protein kinase